MAEEKAVGKEVILCSVFDEADSKGKIIEVNRKAIYAFTIKKENGEVVIRRREHLNIL